MQVGICFMQVGIYFMQAGICFRMGSLSSFKKWSIFYKNVDKLYCTK